MCVLRLFDEAIEDTCWFEDDYVVLKAKFENSTDAFEKLRIMNDFKHLQKKEILKLQEHKLLAPERFVNI